MEKENIITEKDIIFIHSNGLGVFLVSKRGNGKKL